MFRIEKISGFESTIFERRGHYYKTFSALHSVEVCSILIKHTYFFELKNLITVVIRTHGLWIESRGISHQANTTFS